MTGPQTPSRGPDARTILHVDMDAFFVACEVRRDPSLAGLPVVVGGTGHRGVVAAASYEARAFGVHSAMPTSRARRLCPEARFLSGDHRLYGEVSASVHAVLHDYTPLVEPIALDEAFLDVTGSRRLFGSGAQIGHAIRTRIAGELALSCSVGVASTKLLAKLASEAAKPRAGPAGVQPGRGVVVVEAADEEAFLHGHPVQALWGVGPATLARLERLGVRTVGDLAALPEATLVATLGSSHGRHLAHLARGLDESAVVPDRPVKSVGQEETFARDHHSHDTLGVEVVRLSDSVAERLRHAGLSGRTVTLKVRFGDFRTITRSSTVPDPLDSTSGIAAVARRLLAAVDVAGGVRLLGVTVSGLRRGDGHQLSLGVEADSGGAGAAGEQRPGADRAIDQIRSRFGSEAIGPAVLTGGGSLRLARKGAQQWGPDESGHEAGPDHDTER